MSIHAAVVDVIVAVVPTTVSFLLAFSLESMGIRQENNVHDPDYTIVRKPSPIKQPMQCLARSICSIMLISPVEMVLPFFKHMSVS